MSLDLPPLSVNHRRKAAYLSSVASMFDYKQMIFKIVII
jgi:hypothetical protein